MEWSPTRREFLGVAGLGSAVPASRADDSAVNLGNGTLGNATDAVPDHPFAPTATRRWSADASDGPVRVKATGDALVAASHDVVVGLSLDGTERWRFGVELADHDRYPNVLVRDETVYVGDGETVWLLDAADGSVRWEFRGEEYASVRTVTDELALLDDDGLVALSPTDGSELWRFAPERGHVWADRVADGDAIYFGTTEGQFYALDAADGTVRWRTDFPGEADAGYDTDYPHLVAAGVTDDRVLVWESKGRLYGFDRDSGRRRWTVETDSEAYGFPGTVRNGVAYLNDAPHLLAISTDDGSESWRYDFGRELGWKPTVLGDGVYVGGSGEAAAVERDGTERWRFATGDESHASVVDSFGDALVVNSHTTAVYAVSPEDGRLLWHFEYPKSLTWLPRVVGDSVVVGTESGTVYALAAPGSTPLYDAYRAVSSSAGLAFGGLAGAAVLAGAYRHRASGATGVEATAESGGERSALADYELGDRVAEFDSAAVFDARTPAGERVALTRLDADAVSADAFEAAVETWADLDARGVLEVRSWGTDAAPWVATEPVDAALADSVGDSPADLPLADLAHALADAAEAVHRAHGGGVAHGALGPESLWLADGEVRVGDWRLAAARRGESSGSVAADESAESDISRLAVAADDLLGEAGIDTTRPEAVDDVLSRALADDPGERYDSALAFADALRWAVRE